MADGVNNAILMASWPAPLIIRLLLIPAVVFLLTLPLPLDPLARNVSVVLSAMPAGTTTVMLAQKYDRNPQFASKLLVGSTLLSMVTIPLLSAAVLPFFV